MTEITIHYPIIVVLVALAIVGGLKLKFMMKRQNLAKLIKSKFYGNPALKIMKTNDYIMNQDGMSFLIQELNSEDMQPDAKYNSNWNKREVSNENDPFAAPFVEDEVVLHDFTKKHRLMFNKFPLVNQHVLIVTKEFERQTKKLDSEDLQAALQVMASFGDGVIYFNGGTTAGNSQPHKHMQGFPEYELKTNSRRLPLSELIENFIEKSENLTDTYPSVRLPQFKFAHEITLFPVNFSDLLAKSNLTQATKIVMKVYEKMYQNLSLSEDVHYNLVMTPQYMMLVRRKNRFYENISINSPWFMGIVFERTVDKLRMISEEGPLKMLHHVADNE